jgi:hypothetical protein
VLFRSYPTQTDLTTAAWRTANEFAAGDNAKSLYDPSSGTVIGASVPTTATGAYTYVVPASCASPTDNTGAKYTGASAICNTYTLTALLENSKDTAKDSTSTATQTFYIKKSANQ